MFISCPGASQICNEFRAPTGRQKAPSIFAEQLMNALEGQDLFELAALGWGGVGVGWGGGTASLTKENLEI